MSKTRLELNRGETEQLTFVRIPAETTDDDIPMWFSSNRFVATVSQDGTVTAVGGGEAVITVNVNGRTDEVTVNVSGTAIVPMLPEPVPKPEPPSAPVARPGTRAANSIFEAVEYDDAMLSDQISPNDLAPDFTSIGGKFAAGNSLMFKNIDFGDGGYYKTMLMLISSETDQSNRHIDVYIGSVLPENKIAAINPHHFVLPAPKNNRFTPAPPRVPENIFYDCYADLEIDVSGVHDVIIYFREDMDINIDWFTFSSWTGTETKDEKDARMQWFRDARFGQFIHFGAYSEPGGEYRGQKITRITEWIMQNLPGGISREEYSQNIVKPFDPKSFYPDETGIAPGAREMIALAKAAGKKYIAVTTKHHDGFSMYNTQVRHFKDYSIMGFGDYNGLDPIAELARECKEQGIRFGIYYSISDWWDYTQSNWAWNMTPDLRAEYMTRVKAQMRELITLYDPGVIWFDHGTDKPWWGDEEGMELYRFVRTLSPNIVLNNRGFSENVMDVGDYGTPENYPPHNAPGNFDWECCVTTSVLESWGYIKNDPVGFRTPEDVISKLIYIVSLGGSMLLNIGPNGEGLVPPDCQDLLREVGRWMDIFGESIYGTRQSYAPPSRGGPKMTVKDDKVYVFIESMPHSRYTVIPAPPDGIISARDVDSGKPVGFSEIGADIAINLAGLEPSMFFTVIELITGDIVTVEVPNEDTAEAVNDITAAASNEPTMTFDEPLSDANNVSPNTANPQSDSFNTPNEPAVSDKESNFPIVPVTVAAVLIIASIIAVLIFLKRKK
jgi:hypothetical protein